MIEAKDAVRDDPARHRARHATLDWRRGEFRALERRDAVAILIARPRGHARIVSAAHVAACSRRSRLTDGRSSRAVRGKVLFALEQHGCAPDALSRR